MLWTKIKKSKSGVGEREKKCVYTVLIVALDKVVRE